MTISGEFEPSSIVTRFSPATWQICSPTSRLPVKLILRTRGSEHRALPIAPPEPVRQEMAKGGIPASSRISTSARADRGVSLAGFRMTALPAASAGPTLWATRFNGKLKGVMATTTPQGIRSVKPRLPAPAEAPSSGRTSPDSRLASSAES